MTEFVECLYVNYDFDRAQKKLLECDKVHMCLFSLVLLCSGHPGFGK